MPVTEASFKNFIQQRKGRVVDTGKWRLADDASQWQPVNPLEPAEHVLQSSNEENQQDFHYRSPEADQANKLIPLFHENTFTRPGW